MDTKSTCWTLVLCLGLVGWLYWDLRDSLKINYEWHSYLINATNGQPIKPTEMYDLSKIINVTQAYVNSTNAMERLYDLEYNINMENPFVTDQVYSDALQLVQSGWPVANQSKCSDDLKWISRQLEANPNYPLLRGQLGRELTQLMDSFGRPESGLFSGVVTWLGSYKQCQRATLAGGQIKTRYCLARMRPKWWPKNETVHPRTRIRVGVCLPEACDTMSFKRQRNTIEALIKLNMNEFYSDNLELDSMFCLPDERSPIRKLPAGGWLFMGVVGGWLTLVLAASVCYELVRRRQRNRAKQAAFAQFRREFWEKGLTVSGFLGRGAYEPSERAKQNQLAPAANQQVNKDFSHPMSLVAPDNGPKSMAFRLLEALSVHNSLKEFKTNAFVDQQQQQPLGQPARARVNLCCLSSVKFLMAILVILGHSGYLNSLYARSLTNRIDLSTHDTGRMVLSVARCVDTFFIFFGVLTAYTLLRKFSLNQLANPLIWLAVNGGILLRIGPVFALTYWYSRLISPYTSDGPWWDYGVYRYSVKGSCMNEPWWKSLPYFGCSGSPSVAPCVLPAWFLVSYSQLSLIMPLFTYILVKLPHHAARCLLVLFVTLISCLQIAMKMYKQTSLHQEAFSMYGAFLVDLMEKFQSTGTMSTIGRAGCVGLGCYVGYLLRMYELNIISDLPKWLKSRLTLLTTCALHLVVIFLPIIGPKLAGPNHVVTLDQFVGSYVVTLVLWPVLNAILIVNATTVYNRTALVRFFSHSFWHSANKLGLAIYLIHWEVIYLGISSFEQAPSVGFLSDVFKLWSFGVFFSLLLALVVYTLIEAPIAGLMLLAVRYAQDKFLGPVSSSTRANGADDDQKQLELASTPQSVRSAIMKQ